MTCILVCKLIVFQYYLNIRIYSSLLSYLLARFTFGSIINANIINSVLRRVSLKLILSKPCSKFNGD